MSVRPVPPIVLTLIHEFEGWAGTFEPTRTLDPAGNPEIGWSHKLSGPADPLWNATLDQAASDALAMQDLTMSATEICDTLGMLVSNLNDNQYAACIDFTYNEGGGNFASSTFCKLIDADDLPDAEAQLTRWVYAAGEELPGLLRRRLAEQALWNTPVPAAIPSQGT